MKKIIVILILMVLIASGVFIWNKKHNGKIEKAAEELIVQVMRGPIQLSVSSTGSVESNLDVEIMSKASGEIIKLPYDISDYVEKGTLLVELDPEDEERNVKQSEVSLASSKAKLAQAKQNLNIAEKEVDNNEATAKANLTSAQAQYDDAKAKAERMKQLLEKKRVSQEECETSETSAALAVAELENAKIKLKEIAVDKESLEVKREDVKLAQCQVETDTISLETTNKRLKETKVFAPISGVISEQEVQIGQIVSSPLNNVGGGTTLLTLSDLSRIFIVASVDESDIGTVEVGQKVEITADAFPEANFEGEVVRIATKGTDTSNVVTFDVKIEVFGKGKEKLKPGMTANVDILVSDKDDVLMIPSESVQGSRDRWFVFLPGENGEKIKRPVKIGVDNSMNVEITEGLKEGEEVVIPAGIGESSWAQGNKKNGFGGPPPGPPPF